MLLSQMAAEAAKDYKYDIILANVNGKLTEISDMDITDEKVEFITVGETMGNEAYKRSVLLLMLNAIHKLDTDNKIKRVTVEFSLSKGLYCDIKGDFEITEEFLNKVKEVMRADVKKNLPIKKQGMKTSEAIKLFKKVLQNLLSEGISIRDLVTIFETLADHAAVTRDTDILTEYVRQSLKRAISGKYFPPNEVTNVITLDPKVEQEIMAAVKNTEQGAYLSLDPARTKAIMDSLGEELKKLEDMGKNPIVITSPIVRLYFKKLASDYYKDIIVISYNEVESNVELQSVGMVTA